MSDTEKCTAAANLRGEHIPCDEPAGHTGWAHGNSEHGLIWDGPSRPSDAWFGAWECGCTDTERTVAGIPEYCPVHGAGLISDDHGRTKVQLTHSGVSGYGFRSGRGERSR